MSIPILRSTLPRPMSDADVLAEFANGEARVIEEAAGGLCHHTFFRARFTAGHAFDDHVTQIGQCPGCSCWILRVTWLASREIEDRILTETDVASLPFATED